MSYKVAKYFQDLQDGNYEYNVGDTFPRKGAKPTEERIIELAGPDNKQGTPLIKPVGAPKPKANEKPAEK